jgi:hypothetical protein
MGMGQQYMRSLLPYTSKIMLLLLVDLLVIINKRDKEEVRVCALHCEMYAVLYGALLALLLCGMILTMNPAVGNDQ